MTATMGRRESSMSVHVHLFKSKIHRATVTHADQDYEGSVTISGELMDAAEILEHEQVHVWNVTRGTRLTTYAIRGENHSGVVCVNGAAAHHAGPGDKVILATFAEVPVDETQHWQPKVILVDQQNRVADDAYAETAGPKRVSHA